MPLLQPHILYSAIFSSALVLKMNATLHSSCYMYVHVYRISGNFRQLLTFAIEIFGKTNFGNRQCFQYFLQLNLILHWKFSQILHPFENFRRTKITGYTVVQLVPWTPDDIINNYHLTAYLMPCTNWPIGGPWNHSITCWHWLGYYQSHLNSIFNNLALIKTTKHPNMSSPYKQQCSFFWSIGLNGSRNLLYLHETIMHVQYMKRHSLLIVTYIWYSIHVPKGAEWVECLYSLQFCFATSWHRVALILTFLHCRCIVSVVMWCMSIGKADLANWVYHRLQP